MRPSAIVIEWIGACPVRDRCARACHRTRLVSTRLECVVVNKKTAKQQQRWIQGVGSEFRDGDQFKLVLSYCSEEFRVSEASDDVWCWFFFLPVKSSSIWLELVCTGSARIFCSSHEERLNLHLQNNTRKTGTS